MAKCNTWKKFVRKSGQKRRNKISSRELSNQADKFLTPLKLFHIIRCKSFFPPIYRRPQIKIGMTERGAEKSQLSSRACHIPPNKNGSWWKMLNEPTRPIALSRATRFAIARGWSREGCTLTNGVGRVQEGKNQSELTVAPVSDWQYLPL